MQVSPPRTPAEFLACRERFREPDTREEERRTDLGLNELISVKGSPVDCPADLQQHPRHAAELAHFSQLVKHEKTPPGTDCNPDVSHKLLVVLVEREFDNVFAQEAGRKTNMLLLSTATGASAREHRRLPTTRIGADGRSQAGAKISRTQPWEGRFQYLDRFVTG